MPKNKSKKKEKECKSQYETENNEPTEPILDDQHTPMERQQQQQDSGSEQMSKPAKNKTKFKTRIKLTEEELDNEVNKIDNKREDYEEFGDKTDDKLVVDELETIEQTKTKNKKKKKSKDKKNIDELVEEDDCSKDKGITVFNLGHSLTINIVDICGQLGLTLKRKSFDLVDELAINITSEEWKRFKQSIPEIDAIITNK